MRSLVAGGAGFIGSHLCEELLARGHQVLCVDSLVTGHRENVVHLLENRLFELRIHDIVEPLETGQVDYIFHLASPASPVGYMSHPIRTHLTNSVGTHNLLELARRHDSLFLMASTSEIYGDPLQHPQSEDYWGNVNPIGPRSCYDEGKRFAESLTMGYVRQHDLDARIVRIFNTYGPRSDPDDGRVVPNFITQVLRGDPMTVYGNGSQTRSFCFVTDMVDGIYRAMVTAGTKGEVFNLGNPEEYAILDFAHMIREVCDRDIPIVFESLPPDDPTRRRPDIQKARDRLGWQPTTSLKEGLAITVEWFMERTLAR
jgi:nucleoside-diphosphate-sugar epimerase